MITYGQQMRRRRELTGLNGRCRTLAFGGFSLKEDLPRSGSVFGLPVDENARLKRLVAALSLGKGVLQDVLSKSPPASAHEGRRGLGGGVPWLQRAAGLFPDTAAPVDRAQAEQAGPAPGDPAAHARDRGDADPLWLPARAHHAQA